MVQDAGQHPVGSQVSPAFEPANGGGQYCSQVFPTSIKVRADTASHGPWMGALQELEDKDQREKKLFL